MRFSLNTVNYVHHRHRNIPPTTDLHSLRKSAESPASTVRPFFRRLIIRHLNIFKEIYLSWSRTVRLCLLAAQPLKVKDIFYYSDRAGG
jgi:hypothetical protein